MKVGVVGAGLMGAEIALVFALAGFGVQLNDVDKLALERAVSRLEALLAKGVKRETYSSENARDALGRIEPVPDLSRFSECDLVTEAVFESLQAKATVLYALDEACNPACIVASNTSTLPISTLAATLPSARRAKFIGTHYFSPVSRMQLVEVVPGIETDPTITADVLGIMQSIGKTPIEIKDVTGFAVNRLLHAMLIEAVKLVEEGVATPQDLDVACRLGLGHPIGPFAMMDVVTSDLCLQVQEILHGSYGERFRPPPLLKQRVAAGFGGGKGRRGWLGQV